MNNFCPLWDSNLEPSANKVTRSLFAIMRTILLLCSDVEQNPGPTPDIGEESDRSIFNDSSSSDTTSASMENFLKEFFDTHLGILHFNVQSLKPKRDIINVNLFDFDILCFTESWLNDDIPDSDILLDGFSTPFRCDRHDRMGEE